MMNSNRKYQICSRCVMDTTDKSIIFDENGICDHCLNFKNKIEKKIGKKLLKKKIQELNNIAKNKGNWKTQ